MFIAQSQRSGEAIYGRRGRNHYDAVIAELQVAAREIVESYRCAKVAEAARKRSENCRAAGHTHAGRSQVQSVRR